MRRILFLAAVALVAFAGVAYAAGSITGSSIKDGSLTGKDVKDRSLTPKDFKGSVRGRRGARGPAGPSGPAGPQGPAGPSVLSGIVVVPGGKSVAPGDVDGIVLTCPPGQRTFSGGFFTASADGEVFVSVASDDRTSWLIGFDNLDSDVPADLNGEAYCSGAGQAVAARRAPSRAAVRQLARLIAERRAAHR